MCEGSFSLHHITSPTSALASFRVSAARRAGPSDPTGGRCGRSGRVRLASRNDPSCVVHEIGHEILASASPPHLTGAWAAECCVRLGSARSSPRRSLEHGGHLPLGVAALWTAPSKGC